MPDDTSETLADSHGQESIRRLQEFIKGLDEERLRALTELRRLRRVKTHLLIREKARLTEKLGATATEVLRLAFREKINANLEADLEAEINRARSADQAPE